MEEKAEEETFMSDYEQGKLLKGTYIQLQLNLDLCPKILSFENLFEVIWNLKSKK